MQQEKKRIENEVYKYLTCSDRCTINKLRNYFKKANINTSQEAQIGLDYLDTWNPKDRNAPFHSFRYDNIKKVLEQIRDETED